MLNPLDPESAVIPYEVLQRCLDEKLDMGFQVYTDDISVVMGVDLAVGMNSQNDETSYVIVAYNKQTEHRRLLYSWTGNGTGFGLVRDSGVEDKVSLRNVLIQKR